MATSLAAPSSPPPAGDTQPSSWQKRPLKRNAAFGNGRAWKPKRTKREKNIEGGSTDEVLHHDVQALLAARKSGGDEVQSTTGNAPADALLPQEGSETLVEVVELSSTGDGLAVKPGSDQIYVVPFTVPGDTVRVKVYRHDLSQQTTQADFVAVTKASPLRDDSRVRCSYFASCGGCQFQMLEYAEQLRRKQRVLAKAYRNFANLPAELVPPIEDTIGSPLQYGYRTKLTPHFDGRPGCRPHKRRREGEARPTFTSCPAVGFMQKGKRSVLDVEDCPIATEAVRLGLTRERERMQREFPKYERGATILLRESTRRYPPGDSESAPVAEEALSVTVRSLHDDGTLDIKSCVTEAKVTSTEYIGPYVFTNPANAFFQNNNSILPAFTSYVRERILPPSSHADDATVKYLIDAYSGSGLFTISLSSAFKHATGIDIAADSIAFARRNAALNGLAEDRCRFIAADARELFKNVTYPADETVVVLDPPRKGCDADFLAQLRRFGPLRVLYVSCNVHTQARDVGVLVRGEGEGPKYSLESLVGFDFFPQTGHVEGVAILNRQ